MKSEELKSSILYFLGIFSLLSLLMIATRGNHFSTLNNLPSASTAVFFLAGMYLRNAKSFWFFYLLSITIDLASSYFRGSFGDCLTTAYPALAFSYGVMFVIGRYARPNWTQQNSMITIFEITLLLLGASSIAFFISNGSYYVFSGHFTDLSWAEYSTRLSKYFFNSVSNPIFYAVSAILIDWGISRLFRNEQERQSA
jgi:hypothetical protein